MKTISVLLSAAISLALCSNALAQSRFHELKFAPGNVHFGHYDATLKPVLRIKSGDTVRVESGGLPPTGGLTEADIPQSWRDVERALTDRGPGAHHLTGPIYVEGAEPGDVLEVKFLKYEFAVPFGLVGLLPFGGLPQDFPYQSFRAMRFAKNAETAQFAPGVTLKLAPFYGSVGVAPPPFTGRVSSNPPGLHTGNLDNKELVAGSTLYIPVHVPGALLSVGDAHGVQGDGEVSCCALETALIGTMQVTVRKGKRLIWPRAETPTHFITMGLNPDLDEAAQIATREMVDYLVTERKLSREDAFILCSLAMDLRITQVVDGTKGVHAMIPKSIFK